MMLAMRGQLCFAILTWLGVTSALAAGLHLGEPPLDYLQMQGLSVLVYHNQFHEVFRDQKLGGVEMILHGERIATGGEVRLQPTPEQWDAVPKLVERRRGSQPDQLIARSSYPDITLTYRIEVTAEGARYRVAEHLDHPLPAAPSAWRFLVAPTAQDKVCGH